MKRRFVVLVAALAVASFGLLAGTASAHTASLSGVAVCNTSTGAFDITWTLTNPADPADPLALLITDGGGLFSGSVPDGGSVTATQSVAAGTGTVALTVFGAFGEERARQYAAKVTTEGECTVVTTTTTLPPDLIDVCRDDEIIEITPDELREGDIIVEDGEVPDECRDSQPPEVIVVPGPVVEVPVPVLRAPQFPG